MAVITQQSTGQFEFRRPVPELEMQLIDFFQELENEGVSRYFHPHPLNAEAAAERASYDGEDVYYVVTSGRRIVGYAMLRGWDAGYSTPSLGIVLHASVRGSGLARPLMMLLHSEAKRKGAAKIRLKVYPENTRAVALYTSLGYVFAEDLEYGQMVGYKEI